MRYSHQCHLAKKSPLKHIGTFVMLIERQEVDFETEGLRSQLVAVESTFPGVPPVAVQEAIFRRPRLHQKLRYIVVPVRNLPRCHCVVHRPPNRSLVCRSLAPAVTLEDAPPDQSPAARAHLYAF